MAHSRHHHPHHHRAGSQPSSAGSNSGDQYNGGGGYEIRDVWEGNLDEEMANILEIVEQYPFVAMVCIHVCVCVRVCSVRT